MRIWMWPVCLLVSSLTSVSAVSAEKPLKSASLRKAKKAYEAAVAKARAAYVVELDKGIKAAGGAGDLDEANRIAEVKKALQADSKPLGKSPREILTRRLTGTTWRFVERKDKLTVRFRPNGLAVNSLGHKSVWIASDKNTVLQQSHVDAAIGVWKFDKQLKSAGRFSFVKSGSRWPAKRR